MADPDGNVIAEIRAGNARKYSILVDRHQRRAMTLAIRLVGERGEAEELVQDAFLRAFRSLGSFRGDSKFSTWFYRILYNVCMTHFKRGGSRAGTCLPEELPDEASPWGMPDIQQSLETEEISGILLEEIARLPESYRTALTLFYVQEMKYEEMAFVLQSPLGTVKTHLARGRDLLRKRVCERIEDEAYAR